METHKRKSNRTSQCRKKSFFVDIKFLILVFTCVFFALGGLTIIATSASSGANSNAKNPSSNDNETISAEDLDYTSVLYFKKAVLELTTDSTSVSDFLIVTSQKAVTRSNVYGECVTVSINPFVINVAKAGEAQIHLSATMSDGSSRTITAIVVVKAARVDGRSVDQIDNKDTGIPADNTSSTSDSGSTLLEQPVEYQLVYAAEGGNEFSFYLLANGLKTYNFALVVNQETDIDVAIIGCVALLFANGSFSVSFAAEIDGTVVACIEIHDFM